MKLGSGGTSIEVGSAAWNRSPGSSIWTSALVMPPMRKSAQSTCGERLHLLGGAPGAAVADHALVEDVVEHPALGCGLLERLGQKLLGVEDLDAAVAHEMHEGVVLLLRPVDPDDVVEEQVLGVGWGEAAMLQARAVDHDLAQATDLRVHSECHDADLRWDGD